MNAEFTDVFCGQTTINISQLDCAAFYLYYILIKRIKALNIYKNRHLKKFSRCLFISLKVHLPIYKFYACVLVLLSVLTLALTNSLESVEVAAAIALWLEFWFNA